MGLPQLTDEQRRQALRKAVELRTRRARIREQLKCGELSLEAVLERIEDEAIGRMRVHYLLTSLPQVGKVTANRIMEDLGIPPNRRVQGLGKRQKAELVQRFES